MNLNDAIDSAKSYLKERLNTPFIASVIVVWLFWNKVIVFGIFNFESRMTLADRITWISKQFDTYDWVIRGVRISGFYPLMLYCLVVGFIVMMGFPFIDVWLTKRYEWVISKKRDMLKKIQPQKYKTRSEYDAMEKQKIGFESEAKGFREDLEKLNNIHREEAADILELNKEVARLKENNRNLKAQIDEAQIDEKFETDLSLVLKGDLMNEHNYHYEDENDKNIKPHPELFKLDGNKYITEHKGHRFDIDSVKINLDEKQVIFRKVLVEDQTQKLWNYLTIYPDGSLRGVEGEKGNRVKYYETSEPTSLRHADLESKPKGSLDQ